VNNNKLSDEGYSTPQGTATDIHGQMKFTRKQQQKLGEVSC